MEVLCDWLDPCDVPPPDPVGLGADVVVDELVGALADEVLGADQAAVVTVAAAADRLKADTGPDRVTGGGAVAMGEME